MKQFDELTQKQKFFRQNIVRLIIYGGFLVVAYWSVSEVLEIKQERDQQKQAESKAIQAQIIEVRSQLEQYDRIEKTMMNFYKVNREHSDTIGMTSYMKQHLSQVDYKLWQQEGK